MKLRPVYNTRLGRWSLCHDQWCRRGESSIVATITTSLDPARDGELAKKLCERFNAAEQEGEPWEP
jgi:hypothetical protein